MTAPDPALIRAAFDAAERTANAMTSMLKLKRERLRHIAAARQILDGAVETLAEHKASKREMSFGGCGTNPDRDHFCIRDMDRWPCKLHRRAEATLTALAAAWLPEQQQEK